MIYPVNKKTLNYIPVNFSEAARYAGAKTLDENLLALIENCAKELHEKLNEKFSVCYTILPVSQNGDNIDFSAFKIKSKNLSYALKGAKSALILACTMGNSIDRAINVYSELDAAHALIFQALGAERVETYLDKFLEDFSAENKVALTPRFSPGYGDLPLSTQRDIFNLLSPEKNIGLTLNDSLLMSPSKSVTAIVGINGYKPCKKHDCKNCNLLNCEFSRN